MSPLGFASALLTVLALSHVATAPARAQDEPTEGDPASVEPVAGALPEGVRPVVHGAHGGPFVVIRAHTEEAWSRGPVRMRQREYPTILDRAIVRGALPADVRQDLRGLWTLSSHTGAVCRVRLGAPRALRRVVPDFQYPEWNGEDGSPRLSDAEVAARAWDLAEGYEQLVAPVQKVSGNCRLAAWASRARPRFEGRVVTHDARALAALRALPEHRELAEAWLEAREYDDDPSAAVWDERSSGSARSFVSYVAGGRSFTLVVARAHDGCGGFTGVLWALVELTADVRGDRSEETATLRAHGLGGFDPSALIDLDADGLPEVVGFEQLESLTTGTSPFVSELFLGCPC